MSRRRGALTFQDKASREKLTREECEYWLDFAPKIMKIGTEFELNLPSPEKSAREAQNGKCIHVSRGCNRDCANIDSCLVNRHPAFCRTRETKSFLDKRFDCPAKSSSDSNACTTCDGWDLNCRGLECAMFTPFCILCPTFERKGKVVEKIDIRQDAESVRQEMQKHFQPTKFVGQLGKHGVLEVKQDGSLLHNGGIEVPTVGRRIHWNSFYRMSKDILDPIVARGGFVNERSGQHFHTLFGYFDGSRYAPVSDAISELERPMPEIILANLHQLQRRYEPALFWLMSAGTDMDTLTRWSKFRQPLYRFSAMQSHMRKIQQEMRDNISSHGKYASVTYQFCKFNDAGDLTTFHIENRIGDGVLSPAIITAWAMLCYALVMKAIRLSQYGLVNVGTKEYYAKLKAVAPCIINGHDRDYGSSRHADTRSIGPHIQFLRESAVELVQILKPELYGKGLAFDILRELAEKPASLRLIEGDSWDKIEHDLYGSRMQTHDDVNFAESEVREVVDLASIVECDNLEMWVQETAANTGVGAPIVADIVNRLIEEGKCRWSTHLGAPITT